MASVAIYGAGQLGQAVAAGLRARGIHRVSGPFRREDRELALAMQAPEIIRGVGDGDLIGEVAHHALDDPVAGFALVAGFLDEAGGGAVRRVGAVPHFRPAEDRQRRA